MAGSSSSSPPTTAPIPHRTFRSRRGIVAAAIGGIVLVLLLLAFFFSPSWRISIQSMPLLLFAVALAAFLVLASTAMVAWERTPLAGRQSDAYTAALIAIAPFVPGIAGATTVVTYVVSPQAAQIGLDQILKVAAVPIGFVSALVVWFILALAYRRSAAADRANTRIYGELCERWAQLHAHLQELGDEPKRTPHLSNADTDDIRRIKHIAYRQACEHANFLGEKLGQKQGSSPDTGLPWVLFTGYIDLWIRLHRAEEALGLLEPNALVVSRALYDERRIRGSNMADQNDLITKLQAGRRFLRISRCFDGDTATSAQQAQSDTGAQSQEHDLAEQWEVRAVLCEIRRSLNEFRDDSRDALVRARNRVVRTGGYTALAMYVLVSLGIVMQTPIDMIVAAASYFLVGAIVGLFSRLRTESEAERAIEDFGLSSARLIHRPLFSGLAAICGVVLIGMLSGPLNSPLVPAGNVVGPVSGVPAQVVPLDHIFDLQKYPFGLILAALFGLTPSLLIRRLEQETDKYKIDLKSTASSARAEPPAK